MSESQSNAYTTDDDKYTSDSFETDMPASSTTDSYNGEASEADKPKSIPKELKQFTRNNEFWTCESSSDEDDLILGHTIAEINTDRDDLYDNDLSLTPAARIFQLASQRKSAGKAVINDNTDVVDDEDENDDTDDINLGDYKGENVDVNVGDYNDDSDDDRVNVGDYNDVKEDDDRVNDGDCNDDDDVGRVNVGNYNDENNDFHDTEEETEKELEDCEDDDDYEIQEEIQETAELLYINDTKYKKLKAQNKFQYHEDYLTRETSGIGLTDEKFSDVVDDNAECNKKKSRLQYQEENEEFSDDDASGNKDKSELLYQNHDLLENFNDFEIDDYEVDDYEEDETDYGGEQDYSTASFYADDDEQDYEQDYEQDNEQDDDMTVVQTSQSTKDIMDDFRAEQKQQKQQKQKNNFTKTDDDNNERKPLPVSANDSMEEFKRKVLSSQRVRCVSDGGEAAGDHVRSKIRKSNIPVWIGSLRLSKVSQMLQSPSSEKCERSMIPVRNVRTHHSLPDFNEAKSPDKRKRYSNQYDYKGAYEFVDELAGGDYNAYLREEYQAECSTQVDGQSSAYSMQMEMFMDTSDVPKKPKKLKAGERRNKSFSNERLRDIERHNNILLHKILNQKPTYIIDEKKKKKSKFASLPPSTRTTSAEINRRKQQRQIDMDNQMLKRKLESIAKRKSSAKKN